LTETITEPRPGDGYYAAWGQRFSDGSQNYGLRGIESSLRCVRG